MRYLACAVIWATIFCSLLVLSSCDKKSTNSSDPLLLLHSPDSLSMTILAGDTTEVSDTLFFYASKRTMNGINFWIESDSRWLKLAQNELTVFSNGQTPLEVIFDPSKILADNYEGKIQISNILGSGAGGDRVENWLGFDVPVEFQVLPNLGGWAVASQIPTHTDLNDVSFADSLNGWAVGSFGTAILSSDGGITWSQVSVGTDYELRRIHCFDSNNVLAVSFSDTAQTSIICMTSANGGSTWSSTTWSGDYYIDDVCFITPLEGWAVGAQATPPWPLVVLHTVDGGNSWATQQAGDIGTLSRLGIHFVSADTGWIREESDGVQLKTVDGGVHWLSYTYNADTDWASGMTDEAVFYLGIGVGWKVGYEIVSLEPGQNWEVQAAGFDLSAVYFLDSKHGWSVGKRGTILHTSTGGEPVL